MSRPLLYVQITNIIGYGTVVYMLIPIMYDLLEDKKLAYIINIEKWFICILLGLLRTGNV